MKVLMTTDTVGGVWVYALELARALQPHGVEVALATMGSRITSAQHEEARQLSNVQLFPSEYKLEWMEDPWAEVAEAGEWLLWLEQCVQPDVVHLNGYVHGALPWRVPALVVGHSCVLSWHEAVRGEPAPSWWDRYREEVARGLRAATMVAAPTAWMLATMDRHYGPLPESRVVPNGRDVNRFQPREKEPFVLSAGRLWDQAKNLNNLDAIAGRLPWPVCVAGEAKNPEGGWIETDGVWMLGNLPLPVLADWMSRAAIYALPARYEPFGLSILEAALSGCALVIGDTPSLREIWADAALFVSPDSPDQLEAALIELMEDPKQRAVLAARARARALGYTSQRMAAGYSSLYQALTHSVQQPVLNARTPESALPVGGTRNA
jgi:glycogen synthase